LNNSEICVLVSGVSGGGIGMELIKSFKMAPHKYKIVATDMQKTSFGLFETPYRYIVPDASSSDYIDALLRICEKEKVQAIVTGSEQELRKVSQNSKIFDEKGINLLLNPWSVIEQCMDKFMLTNFLKKKGFLFPKFFLYNSENDINNIESYPVIVKPRVGGGSQNVFLAQDEKELTFFSEYLKKYGYEPLIQEYLESQDEEYTIGILYDNEGELFTSIAMKRKLKGSLSTRQIIINPESKKKFVISSGISQGLIDDFKEIRETGKRIAIELGTKGPVNIQCRKTERGIIPFEVNPRFSGTTSARSLVGCNEPDMFCRYKIFGEIPEKTEYKFGHIIRGLVEKYIDPNDLKYIQSI